MMIMLKGKGAVGVKIKVYIFFLNTCQNKFCNIFNVLKGIETYKILVLKL